jgi:hypothetical protein
VTDERDTISYLMRTSSAYCQVVDHLLDALKMLHEARSEEGCALRLFEKIEAKKPPRSSMYKYDEVDCCGNCDFAKPFESVNETFNRQLVRCMHPKHHSGPVEVQLLSICDDHSRAVDCDCSPVYIVTKRSAKTEIKPKG